MPESVTEFSHFAGIGHSGGEENHQGKSQQGSPEEILKELVLFAGEIEPKDEGGVCAVEEALADGDVDHFA